MLLYSTIHVQNQLIYSRSALRKNMYFFRECAFLQVSLQSLHVCYYLHIMWIFKSMKASHRDDFRTKHIIEI